MPPHETADIVGDDAKDVQILAASSPAVDASPVHDIKTAQETKHAGTLKVEEQVHQEMAEDIPPELEALLHTDHTTGLSEEEAQKRLTEFGRNGTSLSFRLSSLISSLFRDRRG